jgi:phosphoglycolate phosphatase
MVLSALAEAGVDRDDAVMIGDTTFDMEMAMAAGVRAIGVDWGYHPGDTLIRAGAAHLLSDFAGLAPALAELWR